MDLRVNRFTKVTSIDIDTTEYSHIYLYVYPYDNVVHLPLKNSISKRLICRIINCQEGSRGPIV